MANDFTMYAGDTKVITATTEDGEGAPYDLTGITALRWKLARTVTSTTALVQKELSAGIEIIDADAGRFDITLDSVDTETLKGEYYHEAELIDALDRVATVFAGTITISKTLIKPV